MQVTRCCARALQIRGLERFNTQLVFSSCSHIFRRNYASSESEKGALRKAYDEYEKWLQKYPRVYKVHRMVVDGMATFSSTLAWEVVACFCLGSAACYSD